MRNILDYLLILVSAFLQTTFFPLNLVLPFLIFLFFRRGFDYVFPRLIFAGISLGLLSGSSVGLVLFIITFVFGIVALTKNYLPSALFIRGAILVLSVPVYEVLFRYSIGVLR